MCCLRVSGRFICWRFSGQLRRLRDSPSYDTTLPLLSAFSRHQMICNYPTCSLRVAVQCRLEKRGQGSPKDLVSPQIVLGRGCNPQLVFDWMKPFRFQVRYGSCWTTSELTMNKICRTVGRQWTHWLDGSPNIERDNLRNAILGLNNGECSRNMRQFAGVNELRGSLTDNWYFDLASTCLRPA